MKAGRNAGAGNRYVVGSAAAKAGRNAAVAINPPIAVRREISISISSAVRHEMCLGVEPVVDMKGVKQVRDDLAGALRGHAFDRIVAVWQADVDLLDDAAGPVAH